MELACFPLKCVDICFQQNTKVYRISVLEVYSITRYVCSISFFGFNILTGKGKAVPLQAWSGPEGSRKLRFPDFMTTAQDCSKVVTPMHRLHLTPGYTPGTHFC
jgi:hypothetical protein